jgi:hypothetical protein
MVSSRMCLKGLFGGGLLVEKVDGGLGSALGCADDLGIALGLGQHCLEGESLQMETGAVFCDEVGESVGERTIPGDLAKLVTQCGGHLDRRVFGHVKSMPGVPELGGRLG